MQSKGGYKSTEIDALFRDSTLIKKSSLELGWKDLTIERRSKDLGERSEDVINKYFVVLWDTQPAYGERADLHGQFAPYAKYPNTLSLGLPGVLPAVRAYTRSEVVACTLEPDFINEVEEELETQPVESLHEQLGVHDVAIHKLMALLVAETNGGGTSGKLYADSLSYALASRLHYVARARTPQQENPKVSVLPRRILQRVIDRMQDDFSANLDLPTLASESGYSRAHFLRMFRAATGKTPHQYLMDLRLDEVQRRMKDTSQRLIDIATDCGFCSHSHLSKVFRQRFGVTPSEYRRKL